jgi:hypothetical protein
MLLYPPLFPPTFQPDPVRVRDPILRRFERRCVHRTRRLDAAAMYFRPTADVALGGTTRVMLVISPYDPSGARPDEVPKDLPMQGGVSVACTIEALLVVSPADADAAPPTWETRKYLPPEPAEWSWVLSPLRTGRFTALLQIRPVVTISDPQGGVSEDSFQTIERPIEVIVHETWWDRIQAIANRAAALNAIMTLGVLILTAMGIKRLLPTLKRLTQAVAGKFKSRKAGKDDTTGGYL